MPLTPSGFWYPGTNDTPNSISGAFSQAASASESALKNGLMNDGVAKFTDVTARTAAFSGIIIKPGTLTYIQSSDSYERWDGINWVPLGSSVNTVYGSIANEYSLSGGQSSTSSVLATITVMSGTELEPTLYCTVLSSGGGVIGVASINIQCSINSGTWTDCTEVVGRGSSTSSASGNGATAVGYVQKATGQRSIRFRASFSNGSGANGVRVREFGIYVTSTRRVTTL